MARERMAKLIKCGHFEGHIGNIITDFMSSQILHHHDRLWIIVFSAPRLQMKIWSSRRDPRHFEVEMKNYLIKIECADLQNEAKTTRTGAHLSFDLFVATSCPVAPYYSLSLSRVSSTSHMRAYGYIMVWFYKYMIIWAKNSVVIWTYNITIWLW